MEGGHTTHNVCHNLGIFLRTQEKSPPHKMLFRGYLISVCLPVTSPAIIIDALRRPHINI